MRGQKLLSSIGDESNHLGYGSGYGYGDGYGY